MWVRMGRSGEYEHHLYLPKHDPPFAGELFPVSACQVMWGILLWPFEVF